MTLLLKCASILLVAHAIMDSINVLATSTGLKSFEKNQIVPDVLSKAPASLVTVKYPSGVEVQEGNELTPTQVKDKPTVTWDAVPNELYTVVMTDPDAPARKDPKAIEFQHWLVGNVPGDDVGAGDEISKYVGSGPPLGTGLHRYIFVVYKQPGRIAFEPRDEKDLLSRKVSLAKFTEQYDLGNPVAGNFYQAQYDDYVPILHQQLGIKRN